MKLFANKFLVAVVCIVAGVLVLVGMPEIRTQPTLRSSPYRCARARTSVRLSLSDRKTAPSYALRCPPSTPGVKKRPPEPSPRPSGPRPT